MKIKLAICAVVAAAMTSPALASGWGDWNHSSHQYSNNNNNNNNNSHNQYNNDDCDWGKVEQCEPEDDKKHNKHNGGGNENCDTPPSSVPSPTAAIAGVALMGMLLGRRGKRKPIDA